MKVCSRHSTTWRSVVTESPSVPDVAAVVSAVVPRVSSVVLSAVLLTAAAAVAVKVRSAGLFPTYLCSISEKF
jgi:hypothetical protein